MQLVQLVRLVQLVHARVAAGRGTYVRYHGTVVTSRRGLGAGIGVKCSMNRKLQKWNRRGKMCDKREEKKRVRQLAQRAADGCPHTRLYLVRDCGAGTCTVVWADAQLYGQIHASGCRNIFCGDKFSVPPRDRRWR